MNTYPLKQNIFALVTGLMLVFSAGISQVLAQEEEEEDIFQLSPFTITAEEDTGYAATNTLAGTRIKSDLKDLAGAVQIITEDFLEDTSSTGIEDLFLFTTNTEVSGPDGNFGAGGGDRRDPNGRARVRGLAEPDRTRGYFLSDIGFDTYNTDRVTIAKGANAILFGLGSPAGLVNNNLKQAVFEERNEIKLRYGSWGANRQILDVNRVIFDDFMAVRIIGLNNQNRFKQKPSFEDERRLYAALLDTPTKTTTIRANMEIGSRDASRPPIITPSSNIPDWVENGLQTNPDPGSASGWSNFPGNRGPLYIFDNPEDRHATLGFDAAPATPGPDGIRRLHYTWRNREDVNAAVSNAVLSDEDDWVFDFRNNTVTGTENTSFSSFDAANITLEQQFSQNSAVEIVYDKQHSKDGWLDRASNQVNVDVSEYFNYFFETESDGTPILIPNPRVGRPYRAGVDNFANGNSEREAFRITAYYDLDLRDHDKLSWLGRHVFTGLYSDQSREVYEQSDNYGIQSAGEIERILEANRNRDYSTASWDRLARNVRYLGPRITGIPSSGTVATRGPSRPNPRIQEISAVLYDSTADPIFEGHRGAYRQVDGSPLVLNPVNAASIDRQEIESIALVAQSYFLDDHIVATYGWREDKAESWRDDSPEFTAEAIALPETLAYPSDPDDSVKDDVFTWGVVGHLPENWRLFGIGLSAHYGESENFVPSPGRITILNEPHPSPAGTTKEYGFSIDLPDQNFYVRVNWYETVSKNQSDRALGTSGIPNFERLWYNGVRSSLQEKEPRDPSVPREEYETWEPDDPRLWPNNIKWREVYTVPPLGMRQALWTPVDPGPDPGTVTQVSNRNNPNVTGVSDFSSEGVEFEGVWNPTSNWTMFFNVAQQKAIKTNVLKSFKEYFEIREPQWLVMGDLLSRPNTYKNYDDLNGNGIPDPGEPSTANTIFNQTRVTQWSLLLRQTLREGALLDEVREWRYNFATSYRFDDDSRLKGWAVGGAYRWQDEVGVGFRDGILSPSDADLPVGLDSIAVADVTQPLFGPSETNVDFWIKHTREIFDGKVNWRIQLNIRNALNNDDLIITRKSGDDVPSQIRIMNPTNFRLTSTFTF
ncbi:MAG: hypothetical protein F7O42_04725 [Opitutae bacterium]|nr:hypothetical protein [Opitutae bacterium]